MNILINKFNVEKIEPFYYLDSDNDEIVVTSDQDFENFKVKNNEQGKKHKRKPLLFMGKTHKEPEYEIIKDQKKNL